MEEKRNSFRVPNPGTIKVKYRGQALELVDISLGGAMLNAFDEKMAPEGIIELSIHHFSINLPYTLLRREDNTVLLTFNIGREEDRRQLLSALKTLRANTKASAVTPKPEQQERKPVIERFTRMDTVYAIRLYCLITQFRHEGYVTIKLDYLRLALGVDMLKSCDSYIAMKRIILEPARHEITNKTDLVINFAEVMEDDKVVAVKFTIVSIIP
ncbi:PilZ domain-containing protein [Legionella sp. CNM-4043-24]|uniref:PilZ domain-containing protein n=1 Tax=Legionella sp. CNM-4043-24 TaxID=3421646 RepID=UPI00403B023B